jgi:hypothetical protein
MRHSLARFLTVEEMRALPTKRLLAYKKKFWRSHPSVEDWTFDCSCSDCLSTQKHCSDFDRHLEHLKQILATREHIPTPSRARAAALRRAQQEERKRLKALKAKSKRSKHPLPFAFSRFS